MLPERGDGMRWLDRIMGRKSASANWANMIRAVLYGGGGESESGEFVSPDTALRCSAVYACVGLLAETVAQLPVKLYRRRKDRGADEDREHPLWRLVARSPNAWQTSFEFREMAMQHLCLRGNFYAYKVRDNRGIVRELLPLPPDAVTVEQDDGWDLVYKIAFKNRGAETVAPRNVLHLRYRTLDGIRGLNPIAYHRETVGLSLATLRHGARLFKNHAKPGGVLKHPGALTDRALARLKESWEASYGGANVGKTAILEEGMDYLPLTMSNSDAQYIETRRFAVEDIARIYRVPLHEVQSTEKTTSWGSGIEQMSIAFVTRTLLPWLRRWESTLARDLFEPDEQGELEFRFLVEGMMRGDTKSRYEAYGIAIDKGWMSPNEVRAKEDLNPREGGDDYLTPLNMRVGTADPGEKQPGRDGAHDEGNVEENEV